MTKEKNETEVNFEQAFARLEAILEMMNSGNVGLDEALKLYEEADKLIVACNTRLTAAERKIETLIKDRTGTLTVGESGQPMTEPFTPQE